MKLPNKVVSDGQLANLMQREIERFKKRTPKSARWHCVANMTAIRVWRKNL